MPAWILTLIPILQAIIAKAPDIVAGYKTAMEFIRGLFGAGVITKEQQDQIMAQVNAFVEGFNGAIPDHWKVEPDPVTEPQPTPVP